jgi:hypothetical protein
MGQHKWPESDRFWFLLLTKTSRTKWVGHLHIGFGVYLARCCVRCNDFLRNHRATKGSMFHKLRKGFNNQVPRNTVWWRRILNVNIKDYQITNLRSNVFKPQAKKTTAFFSLGFNTLEQKSANMMSCKCFSFKGCLFKMLSSKLKHTPIVSVFTSSERSTAAATEASAAVVCVYCWKIGRGKNLKFSRKNQTN